MVPALVSCLRMKSKDCEDLDDEWLRGQLGIVGQEASRPQDLLLEAGDTKESSGAALLPGICGREPCMGPDGESPRAGGGVAPTVGRRWLLGA